MHTGGVGSRLVDAPSLFDTLDQAEHSRKQRFIWKVISDRSMRTFEPAMSSQIHVFLRKILKSAQKDETVDMTPRCQRLASDVICHLGFGSPLSTQTEETNRTLLEAFSQVTARISSYMNWPATSKLLDSLIKWLAHKPSEDFWKSTQNMVEARMASDKDAKHDLYKIAPSEAIEGGEVLLESELWAEAVFFITAGTHPLRTNSDSSSYSLLPAGGAITSTLMSVILFYLSRYPEIYQKLVSEIRSTFISGLDIHSGPQLTSCRYLLAVIDETLRISPASIGKLWREQDHALPSEGHKPFIVDGHVIPPGTMVGISPYSLLHNERYFPEPFVFRPERHFVADRDSVSEDALRAFAPFAIGSRGCGGRAMAYLETNLTLTIASTL